MSIRFGAAWTALDLVVYVVWETKEHFLLHCCQFDLMRTDLFSPLADVPGLDVRHHKYGFERFL